MKLLTIESPVKLRVKEPLSYWRKLKSWKREVKIMLTLWHPTSRWVIDSTLELQMGQGMIASQLKPYGDTTIESVLS